jgi:hypothetical protein
MTLAGRVAMISSPMGQYDSCNLQWLISDKVATYISPSDQPFEYQSCFFAGDLP